MEKSNTSGWAWKLDQWVNKINTPKEAIMLLKYESADEVLPNTGLFSKP